MLGINQFLVTFLNNLKKIIFYTLQYKLNNIDRFILTCYQYLLNRDLLNKDLLNKDVSKNNNTLMISLRKGRRTPHPLIFLHFCQLLSAMYDLILGKCFQDF